MSKLFLINEQFPLVLDYILKLKKTINTKIMKKSFLNYSVLGLALLIFSCSPQADEGTNAEVSEAQEVQEVSNKASNYALDVSTSSVSWVGSKPTGKHGGTIAVKDGSINIENDVIVGGSINIDLNNIICEDLKESQEYHDKLIGHLKSEDFFDVANHPLAVFEITSVEAIDSSFQVEVKEEFETENKPASADVHIVESPTHKVTGNLTLRGTTLSIAFPANISMKDGSVHAEAKFNIDRTLWNVKHNDEADVADKAKDKFIYNTVNVGFVISASVAEGV